MLLAIHLKMESVRRAHINKCLENAQNQEDHLRRLKEIKKITFQNSD